MNPSIQREHRTSRSERTPTRRAASAVTSGWTKARRARKAVVDESHAMLPQVRGMYRGDRARKETLVDFGFRLPSALDNRPLRYDEFEAIPLQRVYVSATPAEYELELSQERVVEQIEQLKALSPDDIQRGSPSFTAY